MIMKEKINVAELIKDCPKGMELDCVMYEDVKFIGVEEYDKPICIKAGDIYRYLTKFGTWTFDENAKCVIFPKGKASWEGFQRPFKDGDVLFVDCSDKIYKASKYIFILNKSNFYGEWHSYCHLDGVGNFYSKETYLTDKEYNPRLATEEEKQKLFQAIKDNVYKWNAETKTLEKLIEPKFKVGDRIRKENNNSRVYTINGVYSSMYGVEGRDFGILIEEQDEWELVPNKFDINTLKPFESRVLVRDTTKCRWHPEFFGCLIDSNNYPYMVLGGNRWKYCIPFEGNEHLMGSFDDCDEYYKTWE